jgi:tetratricopeptide (TPR) repeat protein
VRLTATIALVAVSGLAVAGCAHGRSAAGPPPERRLQMDPIVFRAHPDGQVEVLDAASLFERAGAEYGEKAYAAAVADFDRVAHDYADSRLVVPALYNAGLSLEAQGDLAAAAARYRRITVEHPGDKDVLDAWFRLGKVHADAKNFTAAADTWAQVLARKDLGLADRIEAMARRGFAQFSLRDYIAAERSFREQLAFYRAHESEERLDSDFFLGMSAYYLGEVAHEQYRALPVRLPERQMSKDLEAKARLLLVAQQRFLDAMRVQNPEWATAAGFQIGSLYREFYDDLVGAPVPPNLTGEARDVYLDEVRNHVKTLLQKAVAVHERNILMAERLGETNDWVKRSNEQMAQLRKLLTPGPLPVSTPNPSGMPAPAPPLPRPKDEVKPRVLM